MNSPSFQFLPPRPAPGARRGLLALLRRQLFADWRSGVTTVLLLALALYALPQLLSWGLFNAVTSTNADACQAARGAGACWGAVAEKHRL
ncbi:MAG: amino acid ABC transporter permease, partial [Methylibium sp.]|nr:amino acid ABC transporter permease [Methylibium sp.]